MESGDIKDDQITASSVYFTLYPWSGRLNKKDSYWSTQYEYPTDPWIQVDLLRRTIVTGIITQGGRTIWVEYLQIQYGDSVDTLIYILMDGKAKVSIFLT